MKNFWLILIFFSTGFISCDVPEKKSSLPDVAIKNSIPEQKDSLPLNKSISISELEKNIMALGLIDVRSIDSTIKVDLKYSTCDNFLFMDLYGDLEKAYLQPDVAVKLKLAQEILRRQFPYYSLIIYDAVRPRSVQIKMWDTLKMPVSMRTKYVSNPQNGSLHNFGAAVDLSIIDDNGIVLDMGTPYDYFGELAYPREEERMIKEGKLSYKQLLNRKILRDAMVEAGFMDITTEWWHFNSCFRSQAIEKYKIIE